MKAADSRAQSYSRTRLLIFTSIVVLGCAADLASKHLVFQWLGNPGENPIWWIIEGFFGIETTLNNGAVFGIGQGWQLLFGGLSVVAAIGIMYWLFVLGAARDGLLTAALALVMGGIFGNLHDRLGFGHLASTPEELGHSVRDWILFRFGSYNWPNFNVADMLLVCGAGLLFIHAFRQPHQAGDSPAQG